MYFKNVNFKIFYTCSNTYNKITSTKVYKLTKSTKKKLLYTCILNTIIYSSVSQTFSLSDPLDIIKVIADSLIKIKFKNNDKYKNNENNIKLTALFSKLNAHIFIIKKMDK